MAFSSLTDTQGLMDSELVHNMPTHDSLHALPGYFSPYPGAPQNIGSYSYDEGFTQYIIDPNVPLNANFLAEAGTGDSPELTSSISPNEYELQSYSPEGQFREVSFPVVSSGPRNTGHTHTILPPVIPPDPHNPSTQFDSEVCT